jgi:hypothetical protein
LAGGAGAVGSGQVVQNLAKLPLAFEPNRGQTDGQAKFLTRGAGYVAFFTDDGVVLRLKRAGGPTENGSSAVRMRFVGSAASPKVEGVDVQAGVTNYLIGNDPSKWVRNLPNYSKVRYGGVYPGVDAVFYGNQRRLQYDLVLKPGVSPDVVRLAFEGARSIKLRPTGDVALETASGELIQHRPFIYQDIDGKRQQIAGRYRLAANNQVTFEIARYDAGQPLVIDPVLSFSTYLGGALADQINAIAYDANSIYVAGQTQSSDFPVISSGYDTTISTLTDAFVGCFTRTGTRPAGYWTTFFGGNSSDSAKGIAVLNPGAVGPQAVTVVGDTFSSDLLIGLGYGGAGDAFAIRLNATGTALLWGTYLGGNGADSANAVAIKPSNGDAFVAGYTTSAVFPGTGGGYSAGLIGTTDAFVSSLSNAAGAVQQSTYFGGAGSEIAYGIAYDAVNSRVVIVGETTGSVYATPGFPQLPAAPNTYQAASGGGTDGFIAALPDTLVAPPVYSTFIGGAGTDRARAVALDATQRPYIVGETTSANLPTTTGAAQPFSAGGTDAFVLRLSTGTPQVADFLTYLGGAGTDIAYGVGVDGDSQAYVIGATDSAAFPTTSNALRPTTLGTPDAFLTRLNPLGTARSYSTYLGGAGSEFGYAIAVDGAKNVFYGGATTSSADLPTTVGVFATTYNGGGDAFFGSLVFNDVVISTPAVFSIAGGGAAQSQYLTLTFTNTINAFTIGTITYGPGASGWLTATNAGPTTITITANPTGAGVGPGSYTASFPVDAGADNGVQTVNVTLNVTSTASVGAIAARWFKKGTTNLAAASGGPFNIASDSVLVQSTPSGLTYTASITSLGAAGCATQGGWFSVTSTGTTATSGTNLTVTYNQSVLAGMDVALLPANGQCVGTVGITTPGGGTAILTVIVNFISRLIQPGLTPFPTLTFNFSDNAQPASSQTVQVVGDAEALTFTPSVSTNVCGGVGAITVSPAVPTVAPDRFTVNTTAVTVTVNPGTVPCLNGVDNGVVSLTPAAIPGPPVRTPDTPTIPIVVNVGNQITANPTTLTLGPTVPVLGMSIASDSTPPASQTVALSPSIAGQNYSYSVSINTAGPICVTYPGTGTQPAAVATGWLRATPASGTSTSSITVSVDPTVWAGLPSSATGCAYTGNVFITWTGGTTVFNSPVAIPVNFTKYIQPITTTPPGLPSTGLAFSGTVGAGALANQTFTVNVASMPVGANNFTADVSTLAGPGGYAGFPFPANTGTTGAFPGGASSTASWLTVSPITGAAASTPITVSVNVSNLAAGTYSGTIRLRHGTSLSGPQPSMTGQNPVTIPVTLTLAPAPSLQLGTTATQAFQYTVGGAFPANKTISVQASAGSIGYTVTASTAAGGAWLLTAAQGQSLSSGATSGTATTTPGVITIGIDPTVLAGLANGTYSGNVQVTAPTASTVTQNIPVTLVVSTVAVSPATATFNATVGSPAPAAQTLAVTTPGANLPISSTVSIGSPTGGAWLTAAQSSPTSPTVINLTVNHATGGPGGAALAAGTYTATVSISSPGFASVAVPVSLVVAAQPVLTVTPAGPLSFSFTIGGTVPGAQSVHVESSTPGLVLTPTATTSSGGNWVAVTQSSGTTPADLTISVNPAGLAAGSYSGNVALAAAGCQTVNVAVGLTVNPRPVITATPAGPLPFSFTIGGSVPVAQTVQVTTTPSGLALTRTVSTATGGNWLSATLSAATSPASLTVSVNPAGLVAGSYSGSIVLSAPAALDVTIAVTLTVNAQPVISVTPASLSFAAVVGGGAPTPQVMVVTTTPAGLTVSASATTTSNGAWLLVTPASGAAPLTLSVAVSIGGLGVGVYTGNIVLSTPAAANVTVPVTLNMMMPGPTPGNVAKIGVFGSGLFWQDVNGNYKFDGDFGPGSVGQDRKFYLSTGSPAEVAVVGDWNGDGRAEVGVYAGGVWILDYDGNRLFDAATDKVVYFGGPGWTPVIGDWDGSGRDKIGAVKDGLWAVDYNGNFAWDGSAVDRLAFFGGAGWTPMVGDWNGSGSDKIGAVKDGLWAVDYNGNFAWDGSAVDRLAFFGGAGWTPMVGDWNGSGRDKIGAVKDGLWVIDYNGNYAWDGTAIDRLAFFGGAGWTPVARDWSGTGTTKVGAYLNGLFVVDFNGNFAWDGPPTDVVAEFGPTTGQAPIVGRW